MARKRVERCAPSFSTEERRLAGDLPRSLPGLERSEQQGDIVVLMRESDGFSGVLVEVRHETGETRSEAYGLPYKRDLHGGECS